MNSFYRPCNLHTEYLQYYDEAWSETTTRRRVRKGVEKGYVATTLILRVSHRVDFRKISCFGLFTTHLQDSLILVEVGGNNTYIYVNIPP
jgi:hypothetical protein